LEQGRLIYATSSIDPFGRLDRHLRRLSIRIPSLVSAVRVQVRLLFETPSPEDEATQNGDYRAICWLVEQHHLSSDQATILIEELSKEVLDTFLQVQEGSYEFAEWDQLNEFPRFCRLDLVPLVEACQNQSRRRQAFNQVATPADRAELPSRSAFLQPDLGRRAENNGNGSTLGTTTPTARNQQSSAAKTNYTIACIDDSPTVLNAINSFLNDKGVAVIMINDPVKALMQIIRSKPDLILLDVTMPNLDGYELCSLLRKHPHFKNTPVVMVTSNTGFIDRAKAKLVGASGYLTKPFTQPDLIKMVFKHLS
jgi:twitching motility two-component system response regulator PilG